MAKHFVASKEPSYLSSNRKPDAKDVFIRNKSHEAYVKASLTESYNRIVRPKIDFLKEQEEFRSNQNKVPFVVRELSNKAFKEYPEIVFREYFTRLVIESLRTTTNFEGYKVGIWDDSFLEESKDGIRYLCHAYIKNLGGLNYLSKVAKEQNSNYLSKVYSVCLETGRKLAEKKSKEIKETIRPSNVSNIDKFSFTVDSEDEAMVDKNISSLDIEDISELVKDKVLEVVKDEEVSHEKDEQFKQEIKNEIQDSTTSDSTQPVPEEIPRTVNNGSVDSPSSDNVSSENTGNDTDNTDNTESDDKKDGTTESYQKWNLNTRMDLQTSLLKALTMRCYKTSITESARISNKENRMSRMAQIASHSPVNIFDVFMGGENSDLEYINFVRNSHPNALASTDSTNINSEEVLESSFAEALGLYTALECAFHIKLINPSKEEIKAVILYYSK